MNPVFRKDLLTTLRMRRIGMVQLLFVTTLAGLVLLNWPHAGVLTLSMTRSDDLLLGLMLGQLIVLILAVPGVAAGAISGEREADTLTMLYATRMTAGRIVLGKILAALVFPGLLLGSALPFLGLLNFRGSLDANQLLMAYAVLIVTAVLFSTLSLTISAFCRQTGTALVLSYVIVLAVCLGVMVPAAIILDQLSGPQATAVHSIRALSPVAAMLSILRPQMAGDFSGLAKDNLPSHLIFLCAAGVVIAGCLIALIPRLNRPPAEAFSADDRKRRRQRPPIGSGNPVFAKELRTSSLHGGSWLIRNFYALIVLSLLLSLLSLNGGADQPDLLRYVFQILVALQLIGIAVITPSLTSAMISSEVESGTFEMLRQTRMTAREIFFGKLNAALLAALLPVIALLPAFGIVYFVNGDYLWYTLQVLPVVVLATVFCCIVGLVSSEFSPTTPRATVIAYIAVAAVFVLPGLAWWAASQAIVDNRLVVQCIAVFSPLVVALNATPNPSGSVTGVEGLTLAHECLMGGLCVILLLLAWWRLTGLLRQG